MKCLRIKDIEDGGAKGDKFERDERLLRAELAKDNIEPGMRARYTFYLAQTLRDLGQNEEAAEFYSKRGELGGFAEEVYYARFQMGVCQERIAWRELIKMKETKIDEKEASKVFDKAKATYLAAFKLRPHRAEALYALTKLHRTLGENQEAYDFAVIGQKLKLPPDDVLFLDEACYLYLFDYEISIVAFYVDGKKDEGAQSLERVLAHPNLPEDIIHISTANAKFYL